MHDVLRKFEEKHLFLKPYPHIVIPNALLNIENEAIINQLEYAESLALKGAELGRSRYSIDEKIITEDKNLSAINAFNEAHSGKEFGEKVLDIFEPFINDNLPNIPSGKVKDYSDTGSTFVINKAPVSATYSPRDPHLDTFSCIFSFMYYVRPDNHLKGGNFQLYRYKDHFHGFNRRSRVDTSYLPSSSIELCKEVPYKNNMLVISLNGINSIHGVQPIELGSSSRYLLTGGCAYNGDCYNPHSYLTRKEVIKDMAGQLYQKARIKFFGLEPYFG